MSNSLAASHGAHKSEINQVKRNTFSSFEKMLQSTIVLVLVD